MADDARISTAFPNHPKTKMVKRRLGFEGLWALTCLILWAADNKPDGDLSGMRDEEIEVAVDWSGDEGVFVSTLKDLRFIDGESGTYKIHDWFEHNPWAATRGIRKEAAKHAAEVRWAGVRNALKCEADADRMQIAQKGNAHHPTQPDPTRPTTQKKQRKKFTFDGYEVGTSEVVNHFITKWPEKRKDGSEVNVSRPMFADRVSGLIRQGLTPQQLIACGEEYLNEKPEWPACPQHFFGPGNGKSANFSSFLKMLLYEQSQQSKAVAQ